MKAYSDIISSSKPWNGRIVCPPNYEHDCAENCTNKKPPLN